MGFLVQKCIDCISGGPVLLFFLCKVTKVVDHRLLLMVCFFVLYLKVNKIVLAQNPLALNFVQLKGELSVVFRSDES